ncbi:MAG: NifU family protein [Nitrospinae bacterium]|nr:NifU family protein [Nitrospinota bacterium]
MPTDVETYSSKFREAGLNPYRRGAFFEDDAKPLGRALLEGRSRDVKLFWIVDPFTEVITGARFFAYGGMESNAVAEVLCSLAEKKTMSEALELTGEDVDLILRDNPVISSAPENRRELFILADELVRSMGQSWPMAKAQALAALEAGNKKGTAAKDLKELVAEAETRWMGLSRDEQIDQIEAALDGEIRDYLHNEGGDIIVRDVKDGREVIVEWQGVCGHCASSTGMTLAIIEDNLRSRIYPGLTITPTGTYL